MDVSAAYNRFPIPLCQRVRPSVEIQAAEIESRAFNGIKEADVILEVISEAAWPWEKGMRSDNHGIAARVSADLVQRIQIFAPHAEIVDQRVARSIGGNFHTGNQSDALVVGIIGKVPRADIQIVARDGKDLIMKARSLGYELLCGIVADPMVFGIQVAVGVQFRLKPALLQIHARSHHESHSAFTRRVHRTAQSLAAFHPLIGKPAPVEQNTTTKDEFLPGIIRLIPDYP